MDKFNPHGNGYISTMTTAEQPGGYDLDSSKSRVYQIQNDRIRNSINQKPIAYKIQVPAMQPILAHEDSYHFKRAEFGDHSIYLTKYGHDELFCGGKYTNQSKFSIHLTCRRYTNSDQVAEVMESKRGPLERTMSLTMILSSGFSLA